MISVHWSWLVFVPIVILLLIGIASNEGGLDLTGPFFFILLIIFISIWGGIFWW